MPTEISQQNDLQDCNRAQIHEMERFKWFLGEQIGHDPLRDKPLNDIYCEWIGKYGEAFRKWWEEEKKRAAGKEPVRSTDHVQ